MTRHVMLDAHRCAACGLWATLKCTASIDKRVDARADQLLDSTIKDLRQVQRDIDCKLSDALVEANWKARLYLRRWPTLLWVDFDEGLRFYRDIVYCVPLPSHDVVSA